MRCRHKKNEVFLDVVESVNLLVNSNGTLVLSEVRWQRRALPLPGAAMAAAAPAVACGRRPNSLCCATLFLCVCVCHQVTGVLKMRTYLSGMPECKLGLNDKVRVACVCVAWLACLRASAAACRPAVLHQQLDACFAFPCRSDPPPPPAALTTRAITAGAV